MAQKLYERCCFVRLGTQLAYIDYLKMLKKVYSEMVGVLDLNKSRPQAILLSFMKSFGIHSVVRSSPLKASAAIHFYSGSIID